MLLNTESKAASIAEVSPQKLVLLDLEPTLQKLHCLLASHRHVARNLLITPNPERPNRVPSCYIQSQNQSIKSRIHKSRQKREREREREREKGLRIVDTLGEDGVLATELLQHLGGSGETITALTDGDVEDELLDLDLPHWVAQFLLRSLQNPKPKTIRN